MNNNPNNIKVGDTIFVEQAWEDENGNYHDEFAKVIKMGGCGRLTLSFEKNAITNFLSTAEFFAKDYKPEK